MHGSVRRTIAIIVLFAWTASARAEVSEVRISHGYGVLYLPLMIMASEKLVEKHARAAGLGEIRADYKVLDGGNVINDAMLSGALDIASISATEILCRVALFLSKALCLVLRLFVFRLLRVNSFTTLPLN